MVDISYCVKIIAPCFCFGVQFLSVSLISFPFPGKIELKLNF